MPTLTVSPATSPSTTTADAFARASGTNVTFSTLTGAAGDGIFDDGQDMGGYLAADTTSGRFAQLYRGLMTFDTSALGVGAIITAARFKGYLSQQTTDLGDTSLDIVNFNPVSNSVFVNSDYANVGTTLYGQFPSIAGMTASADNETSLNATGIAAINKTGITRLGLALGWDRARSFTGTWASLKWTTATFLQADFGNPPVLTIDYYTAGTNPVWDKFPPFKVS